jgi:hypothetical protein
MNIVKRPITVNFHSLKGIVGDKLAKSNQKLQKSQVGHKKAQKAQK